MAGHITSRGKRKDGSTSQGAGFVGEPHSESSRLRLVPRGCEALGREDARSWRVAAVTACRQAEVRCSIPRRR